VDEEAHHDRRDAGHHLGEEADEPGERTGAAVLVEVDTAEHAERDRHHRRRAGDQEGAHDGRAHTATGKAVDERQVVGEERPADHLRPLLHHVDDQEHERDQRDEEGQRDDAGGDHVGDLAPARTRAWCRELWSAGRRHGHRAHTTAPDLRSYRLTNPRARMPTPTVSTSSTTPMPMRAARWMPTASPNWLAMMLASVSPGPKMCALMCCELPIRS